MDEGKIIQILGGSGAVGAMLLIVYRIASRVAERMIAAIDRISARVDETRESVVRLEAKVDSALDWRERSAPTEAPSDETEHPPGDRRKRSRLRTGPEGHPAR